MVGGIEDVEANAKKIEAEIAAREAKKENSNAMCDERFLKSERKETCLWLWQLCPRALTPDIRGAIFSWQGSCGHIHRDRRRE